MRLTRPIGSHGRARRWRGRREAQHEGTDGAVPRRRAPRTRLTPVGLVGILGLLLSFTAVMTSGAVGIQAVPDNDSFAGAFTLSGESGTTTGTNVDATAEPYEPDGLSGWSVWWKWTPTADGSALVDTFGSGYDTALGVYTGTEVSSLTEVGFNDDYRTHWSADGTLHESGVTFPATSGTTYYIAVGSGNTWETGPITLSWDLTPVIEVDDAGQLPATAQAITAPETRIMGSLALNDIDLYRFSVDGGPFSAEVKGYGPYPSAEAVLWLFGANGMWIHSEGHGGVADLAKLELADLPAGTYLLAIGDHGSEPNNAWDSPTSTLTSWPYDGDSSEAPGPYTIALSGLSEPYAPVTNDTPLYAVGYASGGPDMGAPSNLYVVNPNTGAATFIGSIDVGGVQQIGITGIDFGLDGLLYAVDNANQRLLTIDTGSGDATAMGPVGAYGGKFPDISFDAYGYLYGFDGSGQGLGLERIGTDGTTEWVGGNDVYGGVGLVVDAANHMYVKTSDAIHQRSPQTGAVVGATTSTFGYLDGAMSNPADFDADGVLYTLVRPGSVYQGYTTEPGSVLETLDPVTGLVMAVGYEPDVMITGLAFDNDTMTPLGPSTQLRLTKTASSSTVAFGDAVTFTLEVRNDGPAAATVTVTDELPAGLTYSTHSGGTYDPTTGVWAAGALAVDATATLTVTAIGTTAGLAVNTASVSADIYVPGPATAGAGVTVGTTTPGAPTGVTAIAGDARVQVSWTEPASDGGSAISEYRIYQCSPTPCTPGSASYETVAASPVLITGLTNGTSYGFAVRAVNLDGVGAVSTTVDATPQYASATIASGAAAKAKGKLIVTFTPAIPPLEDVLATPLTYQVSGSKAGVWVACAPLTSTTCQAKTSAKSVAMRISTTNGITWGPPSNTVAVTR